MYVSYIKMEIERSFRELKNYWLEKNQKKNKKAHLKEVDSSSSARLIICSRALSGIKDTVTNLLFP